MIKGLSYLSWYKLNDHACVWTLMIVCSELICCFCICVLVIGNISLSVFMLCLQWGSKVLLILPSLHCWVTWTSIVVWLVSPTFLLIYKALFRCIWSWYTTHTSRILHVFISLFRIKLYSIIRTKIASIFCKDFSCVHYWNLTFTSF